jgi:hypothetical protein
VRGEDLDDDGISYALLPFKSQTDKPVRDQSARVSGKQIVADRVERNVKDQGLAVQHPEANLGDKTLALREFLPRAIEIGQAPD